MPSSTPSKKHTISDSTDDSSYAYEKSTKSVAIEVDNQTNAAIEVDSQVDAVIPTESSLMIRESFSNCITLLL
jgi:hypothetical protein